ncbi:MAG: DNA polymerase III subunit delta [Pirellulaceae bacterium]|jgi:DNA polymerase-3 subunit delta|nr:DNA polymerase III subunit delta [Pirellulaceae bacterium]
MGQTVHAFEFLDQPVVAARVIVVFGDEPFLRHLALQHTRRLVLADDDIPPTTIDGPTASWPDVMDELCTRSLFDPGGARLVQVRDADDFVQLHRSRLEAYVGHATATGVLLLEVTKWAANTRLYKLVGQHGLQVECRVPVVERGRQKTVDQARLTSWLIDWARTRHAAQLSKTAAALLLERVGPEFGVLDQELAKLALYAGGKGQISEKLVRETGGGWRAQTAWEVIDAALAGRSAEALAQLDRLLQAGESPLALFGPISWSLRRFAAATRIIQRAERLGARLSLAEALEQAGFFKWQREAIQTAERQLKQLGRVRAGQLHQWLLETDLALKGSHSSPDMARLALEQLLLRMDQRLAPHRTGA